MASINALLSLQLRLLIVSNSSSNISHVDITTVKQPQLQIESTTGASSFEQLSLPAEYVAYPDIGFAFKVHNETATFPEAEKRCKTDGGHLATIDSEKKLGYAWIIRESNEQMYVGIYRINDSWISVATGLPVDVPWGPGEPSGDGPCVRVYQSKPGLGNYGCYELCEFVCELPIPQQNSTGRC